MRVRAVYLHENVENLDKKCGWPGCRDHDFNLKQAMHLATFKIKTGRVAAGLWEDRKLALCDNHKVSFKEKYMKDLCTKCGRNAVDENSAAKICDVCVGNVIGE